MVITGRNRGGGNPPSHKPLLHCIRGRLFPYILLAPALGTLTFVVFLPLIRGIYDSLTHYELTISNSQTWAGLYNYRKLLGDPIFRLALRNSTIWTVAIVTSQLVIGLGIALLLNRPVRGRALFRGLMLIPWVVPSVVAALTWQWMYSEQFGVINFVLQRIGWIDRNIPWLGDPRYALPAQIVVGLWKGLPFVTVTLLAGLQAINTELYEAAAIDGAGPWGQFRHVTLPGLRSVISVVTILSCIWTFNSFDLVYIMTKGGPGHSTQLLPTYTYLAAFGFFNLGYAAALGVVMLLILLALATVFIWITEGVER